MDGLNLGVALLLSLAIWRWLRARTLQRQSGLPRARLVYDDASAGRPPERPLVSHRHRLSGRPDFLLERGGAILPVEAKPLRRANAPYASDLLQLAAYCLLVEEDLGRTPPAGILRYAEQSWEIAWDAALRARLLETLAAMDAADEAGGADRSHAQAQRCAGCGMRAHCDQRLA